jgi:AraC-like DNA-binding protein
VVVLSDARHTLVTANDAPTAVPGEGAAMLYGEFDLPMGPASTLLRALPGCLIVRSREASPYFGQLVSILRAVVRDTRPGQQILINNLASTILALAVCEYAYRVPGAGEAFAALLDVRIVRVLRAIHERPGENWNIRTLAALAGMSRSTFAQHFLAIIGMPPMRYVTSWRIGRAKELLQDHCLSVAQVAEMLGYGSEAAFRKLFKRVAGMGPGQARADARRKPASQADAALDETTY